MKYFHEFQFEVDPQDVEAQLKQCLEAVDPVLDNDLKSLIFSLIDLTTLSEKDNIENVSRMCEQVNLLTESYPQLTSPAAICVYPELVPIVKKYLTNPVVNIASVGGGFPASQTYLEVKLFEIEAAVKAGADEIDIVMPVGKFLMGSYEEVYDEIRKIKDLLGALHLKVILETSSLPDYSAVRKASFLAMESGADFIKTSTGKAAAGASLDSFTVMCQAIKEYYEKTGKKIGIKPAGGISSLDSAYDFLKVVSGIIGQDWLDAERFRIGASRLANKVITDLFQKDEGFSYFY